MHRIQGLKRSSRVLLTLALFTCSLLFGALVTAPASMAALTTLSWTGAGRDWSASTSWSPATTLTADETGVALDLADIGGSCDASGGTACYTGTDDVSGLQLGELELNTNDPYAVYGSLPITLVGDDPSGGEAANVALEASPSGTLLGAQPYIQPPIVTDNPQTWVIQRNPTSASGITVGDINASADLELNFSNYAWLDASALSTSSDLLIDGIGALLLNGSTGTVRLGTVSLEDGGDLVITSRGSASATSITSASSSEPVVFTVGGGGAEGGDTVLSVGDVTLQPSDTLGLEIDGPCFGSCAPGTNFSALQSSGAVELGNATLSLNEGTDANGKCDPLIPGQAYTLISATGGITGLLNYDGNPISDGQTVSIGTYCGAAPSAPVNLTIDYSPTAVTATVDGTISNIVALRPEALSEPEISGKLQVGGTLRASAGSWSGDPSEYWYQWDDCLTRAPTSCEFVHTGSSFKLGTSQAGYYIRLQVVAGNPYGDGDSYSAILGPAVPTTRQIKSALEALRSPSGRAASASSILKKAYVETFRAPATGKLVVVWTVVTGRKTVVASATYSVKSGEHRFRINLTRAGRALLKRLRDHVIVAATDTFTARGDVRVKLTRTFMLR